MARSDFKAAKFPELDSAPGKLRENVMALGGYTTLQAEAAMNWYFESRKIRRVLCRVCRMVAIFLTAAAGLIPILIGLYPQLCLQAAHATLCLGIAALWIAMDRFWGFTSGWVRYLQTGQRLSALIDAYRFDMAQEQLSWTDGKPSLVQAQSSVTRMRGLVAQISEVVGEETKVWASEFSEVLKEFDQKIKATQEMAIEGAVQLTVTNGEQCPNGWQMAIDNQPAESRSGRQVALKVLPGLRRISVRGVIAERPVSGEVAVDAKAGGIVAASVTLV